jgi:predicted RNA-binding protein associated with RNAse of E/G family
VHSTPDRVRIHYRRLPDREEIFDQRLLERRPDCVVTFLERTAAREPLVIGGRTALETGSPIIWFTFPGAWHDVGRFHRADGTVTGTYANILTPVEGIDAAVWRTTDLALDVWLGGAGELAVLDLEELTAAEAAGWVAAETAARARAEAAALVGRAAAGTWPPPIVAEWTLERARSVAHPGTPPPRAG